MSVRKRLWASCPAMEPLAADAWTRHDPPHHSQAQIKQVVLTDPLLAGGKSCPCATRPAGEGPGEAEGVPSGGVKHGSPSEERCAVNAGPASCCRRHVFGLHSNKHSRGHLMSHGIVCGEFRSVRQLTRPMVGDNRGRGGGGGRRSLSRNIAGAQPLCCSPTQSHFVSELQKVWTVDVVFCSCQANRDFALCKFT